MLAFKGLYSDIHRQRNCAFLNGEMLGFQCAVHLLMIDTSLFAHSRIKIATKNTPGNKLQCRDKRAFTEAIKQGEHGTFSLKLRW